MSSRSFSAGNYTRTIDTQEDPFNTRVRATLDGEELDQDNPENWSKEKVRAAAEMFQRADHRVLINKENADAFLAQHPEFLDTKSNAEKMNAILDSLYGERAYSSEEFETAYRAGVATKSLTIDEAELVKQQQRAADEQRAQGTQSVTPTMEELETMPLEDLRRLDALENQKRMQRRGEEGGF